MSLICSFYLFCTGFVFGDPHLESVDGKKFDFHGIGDFILGRIGDDTVAMLVVARMENRPRNNYNFTSITRIGVTFGKLLLDCLQFHQCACMCMPTLPFTLAWNQTIESGDGVSFHLSLLVTDKLARAFLSGLPFTLT